MISNENWEEYREEIISDITGNYLKKKSFPPDCPVCGKEMKENEKHTLFICSCSQISLDVSNEIF